MIGDKEDIISRIKHLLPNGWFHDETPILDALLAGPAYAFAFVYGLIQYTKLQTRISTATDYFLDLISIDFFGKKLPRRTNEQDSAFRSRILSMLFRERGTRKGIIQALETLTGRTPIVFEPTRPADTGAYNTNTLGYGSAGGYGSMLLPYQAFVIAYLPSGSGVPNVTGYGFGAGGYGVGASEYASLDMIQGAVTDQDIYDTVDAVKPAGTTLWTRIAS